MGKEADAKPFSRLLGEVGGRLRGGGGITDRGEPWLPSTSQDVFVESSSVAARLRVELDVGIWTEKGCGLEGIGGGSESDDCASSSENGLVWSGLVVLCESGRGGITGFVSIKLCRGLWILLGGELALE
jgi:hypothetical protein